MTTTKLGRQVLGHKCTYECDCDDWCELPSSFTVTFDGDPDDCAFRREEPAAPPPHPASGFAVGVIACCALWCGVLLAVCKVWEWLGL